MQQWLYSKLPICSFTLKAKIPKKHQPIIPPTTLGEHIRKVRLERNHAQQFACKLLNVSQMHLSAWELNQKAPHPKHLENIINYLGYIPNIKSKKERIGTRTKLYRLNHQLSLEEFIQITNIDNNVVNKIENYRFCKLEKNVLKQIEKAIKCKPTFSYTESLK